jgi:hypothetical protein
MSRVYKLLSTPTRLSVAQVKPRPQIRRRPFARYAPTRPPASEVTCIMCLNNSRKFRARVRFALGGTALFIRTSLEKTGLWRPLLNLLSSSVGATAAKFIGMSPPFKLFTLTILFVSVCPITDGSEDGVGVLTACLLILDAGLMMLQAYGESRNSLDAENEDSNESVVSDPSVNLVEVYI